MSNMQNASISLAQVCAELPGVAPRLSVADSAIRVSGVREDSRQIVPGDLYVLRSVDPVVAARHVQQARARGAVAVLADHAEVTTSNLPVIPVQNAAVALAYAAAAVYGHPTFSLDVIGITGTNGKTTTSQLLRTAIDSALGRAACAVMGTVGYRFGAHHEPSTHTTPGADEVARTAAKFRALGATHLAMEVSSHALVQERVRAVRFRVAAFTNLTQDHLDFHGTMDAYRAAKTMLFTDLAPGSCVLNVADATGAAIAKLTRSPTLTVSAVPGVAADIHARSVHSDGSGLHATFDTPSGAFDFETRMLGLHNLENIAVGLGVCFALDLAPAAALAGLALERGVAGRMQRVESADDDVTAVVDYAHTPDALERVLTCLRETARGKLWCVFGCGGDRDRGKRAAMGEVAARIADYVVVTSDNPRSEEPVAIIDAIEVGLVDAGCRRVLVAADLRERATYLIRVERSEAIALAVSAATAGDVILVAGKGHETYQIVGEHSVHFDDCEQLEVALALRRNR
jgi:UDP-N-acetylmuramoyl-L-alanyl-D-glutamate--2,6-diaminopimelate ligase